MKPSYIMSIEVYMSSCNLQPVSCLNEQLIVWTSYCINDIILFLAVYAAQNKQQT